MIHVRLPNDVHKRLKTRVAQQDTTMQEWVESLVKRELGVQVPYTKLT
jgi:predicted HicB family RNase H-like nuclease